VGTRICGARAGTRTALCAGEGRVELSAGRAGAGRARVKKFFVRETQC